MTKPAVNSISLGGKFLNLHAISRLTGISRGFVHAVVNGEKTPSTDYAQRIAAAIGMGLEEFLLAIDQRVEQKEARAADILEAYKERRRREKQQDRARVQAGKAPIPRLPAFQLEE